MIGYFVVLGVWLACIFGPSFLASGVSPAVAGAGHLVFTAITGLVISTILWGCTGDTIIMAFALTTGVFSVMSVIGCTTKRDLSGLGTMCMTGLFGIIIAGGGQLVHRLQHVVLDHHAGGPADIPGPHGLPNKQVKELAMQAALEGNERAANQVAIMGAVGPYPALLNIFLRLLRILDFFRGEQSPLAGEFSDGRGPGHASGASPCSWQHPRRDCNNALGLLLDRDWTAGRAGAALEGHANEDVGELVHFVVGQRAEVQVLMDQYSVFGE